MNFRKFVAYFSFVLLFASQPTFAADNSPSSSLKTIATVVNYLNHYPEGDEKKKLQKIVDNSNSPAYEKTIASAILHMEHSVTSSDKKKLSQIISDNSAPKAAREIAKIVHGLNHKASSSDKATLKKYMW